eukprot:4958864-Amphidinium_carterae.1
MKWHTRAGMELHEKCTALATSVFLGAQRTKPDRYLQQFQWNCVIVLFRNGLGVEEGEEEIV